jgi:hypothetical protein
MKKTFLAFILLFIVLSSLNAQIEGISNDSISVYLSQKWKEKARFLNRKQVAIFGDPMEYEFKVDNSFVKKYDDKATEGRWSYDSDKKVIQLRIANKTDFYVVSLNKKELLLSADLPKGSDKGSEILVLLHRNE